MEDALNLAALNVASKPETSIQDAAQQLTSLYERMADRLPGAQHGGISALRNQAIEQFSAIGLPHRRVEEWKYTDLRRMMTDVYAPAEGAAEIALAEIETALGDAAGIDAVKLVLINGAFRPDLSSAVEIPPGVELMSLAEALRSCADWVLEALGKINAQEGETINLLNMAFMSDGVVLRLANGVALPRPVHLIHVTAGDAPRAASLRNLIIADEGAEGTVIESYVSLGGIAAQTNSVTEVRAAPSSKIRHYKISSENAEAQHLSSVMVDLAERSDYLAVNFADGTALSRHQTFMKFSGDHARGRFYGVQLLSGRQHCDMTLVINHDAVGCESREHVKAVLADHAQGVFQAKVMVRPGAQQTDGRQMAQALLLSENAEFDSKPELEIYADDVKCNHGATSGALDDDLMFYLRARGIPEEEARSLLIQAFIGEIIERIEHEGLQEALRNKTARWLG